jgi:ubiquinone/menaquinone biosynthesis C-methylase UbiE
MSKEDVIIGAFSEMAPSYEAVVDKELRRFWGWSYEGFVRQLLKLAPVRQDDVILDVATGTAVIPRRLAQGGDANGRIVGLDITLSMLKHAQRAVRSDDASSQIALTCASALAMPFPEGTFDAVICGLATHHMDVSDMLCEARRVLKAGGYLTVADVAASPYWKLPGIRTALRMATFAYFLSSEGVSRAWAESDAVSHVLTADEWCAVLNECGFAGTKVTRLPSRRFSGPAPLVLRASKG